MKRIQSRMILAISLVVILFIMSTGVVFKMLDEQNKDALLINIAGRQRMLSQRISKNVFLLMNESSGLKMDRASVIKELEGATNLFESTLIGFKDGGEVTDTSGNKQVIESIHEFPKLVEEAVSIWSVMKPAISSVINAGDMASYQAVLDNSNKILVKSDELVSALQLNAEAKVERTQKILLGSAVLALLAFIASIVLLRRLIIKPLEGIVADIKQASLGDYSVSISPQATVEMQSLSDSLNEILHRINQQAEISLKLAKGEMVNKNETFHENDSLSLSQNYLIDNMDKLVKQIEALALAVNRGNLNVRADLRSYEGRWAVLLSEINDLLQAVEEPINVAVTMGKEISNGRLLSEERTFNGSFGHLVDSMCVISSTLQMLIAEINRLTDEAQNGDLSVRGNTDMFRGEFTKVIDGVNHTLDTVTTPIAEMQNVLRDISEGRFDTMMQGNYLGDYALVKSTLNATILSLRLMINELVEQMNIMANGDYSKSIKHPYHGEWESLRVAFNKIIDSISYTLSEVTTSSSQISQAADSLSRSSHELSQAATEQQVSIGEISKVIQNSNHKIEENARSTSRVSELIHEIEIKTIKGNEKMLELEEAMSSLSDGANAMKQIIGVIDEIAFQTNLLALNAAVEAARAGQQGKGFAVVAGEVKNLAARSANSADETATLIDNSFSEIKAGRAKTDQVAKALREIRDDMEHISAMIKEIDSASEDQLQLSSQVNSGIREISSATTISSTSAERTASASEELSGQVEVMRQLISQYRI